MKIEIKAEGKPGSGKTLALKKLLGNLEIQGFECFVDEANHFIMATKADKATIQSPNVSAETMRIADTFKFLHFKRGLPRKVAQSLTTLIHNLK